MPTGLPLHPYQILLNYLNVYGRNGLHKILASGEITITEKGIVVSLARDMPAGPPLHSYQILSNISKGIKVTERTRISTDFCFREDNYITRKVRVVSLARDMPTFPLFIPIKYYQIISNSMGVMACTRFWLQGR